MPERPPPTFPRYLVENLRRTLVRWKAGEVMGAIMLLILTALGYSKVFDDPDVGRSLAAGSAVVLGFLAFVLTPWQMWRDSQVEIAGHEERLRPRISFVFRTDELPYIQQFDLNTSGHRASVVRIFRVGLRNESS